MTTDTRLAVPPTERPAEQGIVDCDVHVAMASPAALDKHLPARWRRHRQTYGGLTYESEFYPRQQPMAARTDAWPPSGLPPAADLDFLREQLLDRWNVARAVMTPIPAPCDQRNPGYAAALTTAWNAWQLEAWADRDDRLVPSLYVTPDDPDQAIAEIERWASDRRFAQVFLMLGTNEPAGHRRYWKVYEAAAANGLPVAFHFGAANGNAPTGAGYVSYYFENHCAISIMAQDQVTSLVMEGTFDAIPELRIVLLECGVAWMAPLMWRLDQAWERLGSEVPHVTRPPSAYIRERFWLTTQPMEEPPKPEFFMRQLDYLDMPDRLMFATDYPHWDFDAPDRALPPAVPADLRHKIMWENACRLYGFPDIDVSPVAWPSTS